MDKYQTFTPRFFALLIDAFIFLPIGIFDEWFKEAQFPQVFFYFWLPVANLAAPIYTLVMHGLYGQTLGKMAMRVKVLDVSENPITFKHAFLREFPQLIINFSLIFISLPVPSESNEFNLFSDINLGKLLMIMMLTWGIADIIIFLTNKKRRALHDYLAGTVVIRWNEEQ